MNETTQVSDQTQEASGDNELNGKNERDFVAYETYRKTVGKEKKLRSENEELLGRLRQYEEAKLEQDGKQSELIAAQRKQISDLESRLKQSESSYAYNVVGAQFKSELAARGVGNPDKVFKYAAAVHKDDLNAVEVDRETYNVNDQDLKRIVDKILTENADMGFVAAKGVKDMSPRGDVEYGESKKAPSEMSLDEIKAALLNGA